ncbi:MAG: hypothetical protein NC040_08620 [Muribaculaceae bacterium]|nr:hypothetical protein [Alistipes senegalensis]MCM1474109.1 hypothetical protein [Muribaculaceae bacterium]
MPFRIVSAEHYININLVASRKDFFRLIGQSHAAEALKDMQTIIDSLTVENIKLR